MPSESYVNALLRIILALYTRIPSHSVHEQLSKFGITIVVDLLCGLFLSHSSQRTGSNQIHASSQTSIQKYGRGRTICRCVWRAPIWQQGTWQSVLKRPSILLSGLHGLFNGLNKPFHCTIWRWMVWCTTYVLYIILPHKFCKLLRRKLRSIICYYS